MPTRPPEREPALTPDSEGLSRNPSSRAIDRISRASREKLGPLFKADSTGVRNERAMYWEAVFQSISNAGALSFISVYLVRLGAPSWLVGFYTSLPALVTILFSLPMGSIVQRKKNLVATINWTRSMFRIGVGTFAFLPYLPAWLSSYVLVAIRGLIAIPDSALQVAQTTIFGQITTPQRRPRMISTRSAIMGLFSAGVGFMAGQWLDLADYPFNYQLLFFTAFLSGIGSVWAIGRIRPLVGNSKEGEGKGDQKTASMNVKGLLSLLRDAPAFRSFATASFIFRIGMSLPMGLYSLYRVRVLGSSDSWIGILYTVQRLLNVLSYFLLSRLVTREGFRRWLWVGCLFMALYPFTTALAKTPEQLLLPSVILGVFSPSMSLFLTDTLFLVSPEEQRPTFVAANTFLSSITRFAVPILGTLLADLTSIPLILIVGAGMRFVGGFSFWIMGVSSQKRVGSPALG